MKVSLRVFVFFLIGWISIQVCFGQATDQEVERREAAAGFLLPSAMALSVLRLECRQWLATSVNDVDNVAREWWQRNRDDIDAATWITGEAIRRYRATLPQDKALSAERQILQSGSNANLYILRSMFRRQLPTSETCIKAVQRYKLPNLDVANLATTTGYEKFGEFGATLKQARLDKTYRPMDDRYRTFETQIGTAQQPLVTLDAIEAAKERKDSASIFQGFMSLANRDDPKAFQSIGMFYLNGQNVSRDYKTAMTWFYNSWVMGEADGINALGVMARDGLGMPMNNKLAVGAFAVAKQMAANGYANALERATSNYTRLAQQMAADDLVAAGCMSWEKLDSTFRSLALADTGVVLRKPLKIPQGTLAGSGLFTPQLTETLNCGN